MKNSDENSGGFTSRDIKTVVLLLLKAEALLNSMMKSQKEHPDVVFTIQLKETILQIRTLLNVIMKDELTFLDAELNGIEHYRSFLVRMEAIAVEAKNLLLFVESFQFVSYWIFECIDKIKEMSSHYHEKND
ncbi:MAG: hypothetical protein LW815_06450 [Chitinophagaceae bacterium]|nr:hypothetical protein [Chitinophagaceae bacterium]